MVQHYMKIGKYREKTIFKLGIDVSLNITIFECLDLFATL